MSEKEVDRISVCEMLESGLLKHRDAAARLKVTVRQSKRLLKSYRIKGKEGLISKKRGKASNRSYDEKFKTTVKSVVEDKYNDFGPTLAAEKLKEEEGVCINKETLRKYMIEWGMWKPGRVKRRAIHQQRQRRERFGELVQIDGSHHDWFEGRAAKCCLIVFVDDATSKILAMHFKPTESTQAYFECAKKYLQKYGRPLSFYNDRHGVFKVNKKGSEHKKTQFGRAMGELNIEIIYAHSAEAKGRVERANRTLQDRLIKEMRLKGISDIETANSYVDEYIKKYNKNFGKKAAREEDAHRKDIPEEKVLDVILSERHLRKLSRNLEFSFDGSIYQVAPQGACGLRDTTVSLCRFATGEFKILHNNKFISCRKFKTLGTVAPTANEKDLNEVFDRLHAVDPTCKTRNNRPWKKVPLLRKAGCCLAGAC